MVQLSKPSRGHITQRYGNTQPDGLPHAGQDYAYTNGAETFPEVYAAADGVVQFAGDSRNLGWPNPWYVNPDFNRADNWDSSAGNLIALRHKQFSADTGYGHLEKCFVKVGDTVTAGQVIGIAGETGNSRGKHLHFFLMFHPFNYNTPTYGCSDPNPYLGGLSFQSGTITPTQEDELSAEFERDVRAQLESDATKFAALDRDLRAQLDGLPALDRDLRADLSQKGQQITALTSTTEALAGLVGHEQGLDVEQIKQAVTEAIAAGLTITVEAAK